ncbi:MAG: uncharacterized membrane protein YgdD (TMEM256/DUF423 family) [Flavobacteriaceae bacterium]|jgi:uncharacterized membrane protein YgdD (TMEM256/DUF423 family)|uniref:DUF423 domain-containing protein n=1 Tax=Candidatus Marifrigoribacter sp. Uisw_064 TaxID=3230970 RepID=UPI003AE37659
MENFNKKIVVIAAFLGALTIAIGAFGAHGLKELVDANALKSFETGVRYQMYHIIVLLVIGLTPIIPLKVKKTIFLFFIIGILLFSGSIYLLSLNAILPFNAKSIAFITPIGGLSFIIGWFYLCYSFSKIK